MTSNSLEECCTSYVHFINHTLALHFSEPKVLTHLSCSLFISHCYFDFFTLKENIHDVVYFYNIEELESAVATQVQVYV